MKTISRWLYSHLLLRSLIVVLAAATLVGCENASPPAPASPSDNDTVAENSAAMSTALHNGGPDNAAPMAPAKDLAAEPATPTAGPAQLPLTPEKPLKPESSLKPEGPATVESPTSAATPQEKQSSPETWSTNLTLPRDVWDVMYLGNSKIGSMHTHVQTVEGGTGTQLKLTLESLLRVSRGGQATTQRISVTSRENLDGEMLDFIATIYEGDKKTEVTGTRLLNDLVIQVTQPNGQASRSNIPWKKEYRGPFALEQELLRQPLRDGESREIPYLSIPLFRLAKLVLKGGAKQRVAMVDGSTRELQEVSVTITLDQNPVMETIAWVDEQGETLKSAALGLQVVTYRSTQSSAESVSSAAQTDLLKVTSVPLPPGTPNLHLAKSLTYNIRCSKDPLKLFPTRTNQTVRSAVALECDITVYSVTPDTELPEVLMQPEPPTDADLNPSPMIEAADPLIVEMAFQVLPEETDAWKIALSLERFVHDKIERKDFSRTFATAAEVAKGLRGDCTEHGVLLAALLRARKIPARIASGLVYVDSAEGPTMGYHLWNEAFIGNRWIPLDAVMGKGGIGPGHIKVMDTPLADQNPYVALLPVLQVLGDVKITSVKAAD